ncbi:helix-turn-helix domain-containing protein [Clostridium nigeriense]|uniref:helix-turn-helix domain-containing protein n=1 Tax=Clostridium nigeriense TaxID=1805470 RepID=UPI003D353F9F
MFYENKNTIYKEIFKTIENTQSNIYYNLPERTLKDKIYKLRVSNGLTQKEFATKTGVSYSSICKYETGYNISSRNKEKICTTFNISLDYLNL